MDNGQMARWVARVEHFERIESQKRDEQFWHDIRPDDSDIQVTRTTVSTPVHRAGVVAFIKQQLASFSARLETKREPHTGNI